MPPVFVVPALSETPPGDDCALPEEEAVHARRVLRLKPGAAVQLIDGRGVRADAVICVVAGSDVRARPGLLERVAEPAPAVRVLAAPPKGARAEAMVDGLAQLGVRAWVPLLTERGQPDGSSNRRRRWERAALEAAKQCGRATLLAVEPAATIKEALATPAPGRRLRVLADPTATGAPRPAETEAIDVFVGPEGGFAEAEIEALRAGGAVGWRLGPHILRIETAAVAAAALAAAPPGSG